MADDLVEVTQALPPELIAEVRRIVLCASKGDSADVCANLICALIRDYRIASELAAIERCAKEHGRLREWGLEISRAIMRISGGGSEMTLRIGEDFYADPKACEVRINEKIATLQRLIRKNRSLGDEEAK